MQIIAERTSSTQTSCQHKTIPYSHHKKKSIERSSHKKIYRMKFLHLALSSVTGDCVQMIHKCRVKWLWTIKYYQHTHTHTQQRKEGQKPPPKPYTYVYSCVGDSIRRDAGLTSPLISEGDLVIILNQVYSVLYTLLVWSPTISSRGVKSTI